MTKKQKLNKVRNEYIYNMRKEGETYETIGQVFGLTRERIRQIVDLVEMINNSKINKWKIEP